MSIRGYFNKACRELGLEHKATISIGHLLEAYRKGILTFREAVTRAKYIYNKAIESEA